jgi:hypothetical protein
LSTFVLLTLFLLLSPIQVASPKISVWISFEPQVTSVFFYDTILPVVISINVTNLGTTEFAGGNLTCVIDPPSGKYTLTLLDTIPKLEPGESVVQKHTVQLQEAGVYTVTVLWLETAQYGRIMGSQLYGPAFAAQNFQGPEVAIGIALTVVAVIVTAVVGLRKRK